MFKVLGFSRADPTQERTGGVRLERVSCPWWHEPVAAHAPTGPRSFEVDSACFAVVVKCAGDFLQGDDAPGGGAKLLAGVVVGPVQAVAFP